MGHGSPEDFPWSPWDFGMGRTVHWTVVALVPVVPLDGKDRVTVVAMGVLRISHGPLGTLECSDRTQHIL